MYCLSHDFGGTKPSQKNPLKVDILAHAYAQCRSNKGAPGLDGQDFADIIPMAGFNVVALIEVTEQRQELVDFFRTLKSSVLATSSGWIRKTAEGRLSVCYGR